MAYTRISKKSNRKLGIFSLRMALGLLGIILILTLIGLWVGRPGKQSSAAFAQPDVILDGSTYVLWKNEKQTDSIYSPFILNPSGKNWDTLFVNPFGDKWIFSVKKGQVLLRSKDEQVKLGVGYAVYYDPKAPSMIWKKPPQR